MTITNGKIF